MGRGATATVSGYPYTAITPWRKAAAAKSSSPPWQHDFNENAAMRWFSQRNERDGSKKQKCLSGYTVSPQVGAATEADPTWEWANPGLRLKALKDSPLRRQTTCPVPVGESTSTIVVPRVPGCGWKSRRGVKSPVRGCN